ncbi:MAG: tRNA (adenosine(37)-N6)-threonylcarbamoyltransferase complex ATPase subunit type 1 TsaE [Christensenellaceae bacterium]|jgi:tRNA threonylcarbamoyladenosine biosynthesis protein TsaE|nr:tRNA (adenosine(37)-N6)-threonylcarbamoyltransferase complex ATPase subunit type 1 TsaE [Christensenellaceae bacterium]
MRLRFNQVDESALQLLAQKLARGLFPGAFLALYGDLGAGKTAFVRALAQELGIFDVQSPTFTIVREHAGTLPLFHFDAYRLADAGELYAIGFEDYLTRAGVIAMEWCENVPEALPDELLAISLAGSGLSPRTVTFDSRGAQYDALLEALQ